MVEIKIDNDKCDGCGKCVEACPPKILAVGPNELDPLADNEVVTVIRPERKKIKYTCMPCKPVTGRKELPCVTACPTAAISHSW